MLVQLSCPQCGAPLQLEETEHILNCAYCRVRLIIFSRGPCRYYLEPAADVPAETLFYMPYWRLKGIGYALSKEQMLHKLVDTSILARKWKNFPFSLGLRPQALALRYVTPSIPGYFLQPNTSRRFLLQQIGEKLIQGTNLSVTQIKRRDFVGEVFSLIYAPFYTSNKKLYDGITQQAVAKISQNPVFSSKEQPLKRQNIDFKPTLCPYCGWDMLGASRTVVLLCPGCYRAWFFTPRGFREIALAMPEGKEQGQQQLPFWQLSLKAKDISINSKADLIRLTNLPQPILPKSEKEPLYFWTPAFKVRPDLFLRISRQMTMNQLQVKLVQRFPGINYHPVDLPFKEALQSLPYLLTSLGPAKGKIISLVAQEKLRAGSVTLVYLPFDIQGTELLHKELQMSIPQKAIQFGDYL